MKIFRKLKLASAISLAITAALPAYASVQLEGDVQLTDESYTEGLQWTPDNAGEALNLNNISIYEPTKNTSGVLVNDMDNNIIQIKDSVIGAADGSNALSLGNATASNVLIEYTVLAGGQDGINAQSVTDGSTLTVDGAMVGGSGSGIYTTTLDGSALNVLNGSEVMGGDYGIGATLVTNGSTLTVDGAKVRGSENSTTTGIRLKEFNNSELNIQNGSQIIAGKTGVYVGSSQNGIINISDSEINVGVGTDNQTFGVQVTGDNTSLNIDRSNIYVEGGTAGAMPIRLVDSTNSTVNINDSEISGYKKNENGDLVMDLGIYVQSSNDSVVNVNNSTVAGEIFLKDTNNTEVNVSNSHVLNGIGFGYTDSGVAAGQAYTNNTINFDNSVLEGAINGSLAKDSHVNLTNGSSWIATGESNIENISVTDSTVDIQDAIVGADNWASQNANLLINSGSELSIGTGNGDLNVVIKSDGKELETAGKDIIRLNNGNLDIHADAVDVGAYKYELVNKGNEWVLVQSASDQTDNTPGDQTDNTSGDQTDNTSGDQTGNNSGDNTSPAHPVLSNSANAVLSSLAAPQASWNSQTSTLYERMSSGLEKDAGGVWGSYYGNEWAGEAGQSSTFNQKINGLAIGADKTLKLQNGTLTLGAAIMHDYSHLSDFDEKGSGGSMNSTALQAYGNLELDNGLFFKGTASAGRTDSNLHVRSSDGALSQGDYKQTLFGLTGQAGYRYQITEDVYVAPYAQMNSYTASGVDFKLDNGMKVSSDRYWSARGELGIEAGMKTSVGGIEVTPHIMAAGSHEFVKHNDVHLNDLRNGFDNTVDGSGYRFGAGVEAQLTKSFSAGVNVSYSRSKDVEQRYDISAGLRYSF